MAVARKRAQPAQSRTLTCRGRKVSIREKATSVDVRIDNVPVHVEKLGPNRFHSHVAMFRDYESLDELIDAMLADEGTLWLLHPPAPGHTHGPHMHGDAPESIPPTDDHGHEHG